MPENKCCEFFYCKLPGRWIDPLLEGKFYCEHHRWVALDALKTSRIKELEKQVQQAGNLLAIIHRDGGHYITEHGWEKACEDAEAVYFKLRQGTTA